MPEGMWLTSLKPIIDDDTIVAVEIRGRGFDDKLKTLEAQARADGNPTANAFEIIRDRLRASSQQFTEKTEITRQPLPATGAYARDVTMELRLKRSIKLR
jgi:hypothetical protein